jgi:uncharacterized membrane protein
MLNLVAASAYFLLIHFGVSGTRLRDVLVARLGAGPYRGAFALASVLGIVWMIYAYRHAPAMELWGLLLGLRPAAYVLVFIAFLFVVIGIATPTPTRVGMDGSLLLLALGGTVSIDAKRRRLFGEQWTEFAGATSNIPFAAIATGKNELAPALFEIGASRLLVAALIYAVAFYLHGRLGLPLT